MFSRRSDIVSIEKIPLDSLNPAPYNPRDISDDALQGLKSSMDRFGCVELIVWNKRTGNIVSGHQRFKVLQSEGVTEVDAVIVDLDETEEKALNVAMNNPHIAGDFTPDLQDLLGEIKVAQPEMFVDLRLDALMEPVAKVGNTDPDEIPEVIEPVCQPGQIWQLGMHRVMCGDSTDAGAVALLMDGSRADMVFTDPPYNVDYEGKTKEALKIQNDAMAAKDWHQLLVNAFSSVRSHTTGAIYCCIGFWPMCETMAALRESGWHVSEMLVWVKDVFTLGRSDYQWKTENIIYGWNKDHKRIWNGERNKSNIFEVARPKRSREHPTMKPIELMEPMIKYSSNAGGIICEPFLGSGSTLIACERLDRACYGMEIDPHYCDVIIKRWEDHTGYKAHLTNG